MSSKTVWDRLDLISQFSEKANRFSLIVGHIILIGAAAGVLAGAGVLTAVGLVHLAFVITASTIALILAYSFRLLEYVSLLWRRIFLVCPHAGCYRRIALPVYICPKCSAQHKQLIPGPYGTFRRQFMLRHGVPSPQLGMTLPPIDCRRQPGYP